MLPFYDGGKIYWQYIDIKNMDDSDKIVKAFGMSYYWNTKYSIDKSIASMTMWITVVQRIKVLL